MSLSKAAHIRKCWYRLLQAVGRRRDLAIITWIKRTYHRRRRQRRLGSLTPVEYETLTRAATAA